MTDTQPQSHVRWQHWVGGHHVSLDALDQTDNHIAAATWDHYPSLEDDSPNLEYILDALEALDADTRAAIERTVVAGMSLADAAIDLGWRLSSGHADKKRVMRARDSGLRVLAELLGAPHTPPVLPIFGHVNEH